MARDFKPTNCRHCGDPMMWVATHKGGSMPINYDPELERLYQGHKKGDPLPKYDRDNMTPHFTTCPFADKSKKG